MICDRLLEETSACSLVDHRGPYVGDDTRQRQVIEAIAGGRSTFLISAPAGCGKSRFALELARTLGRAQRSWDVRFVRHDEPALTEELHADPKASRTILIVDDAQDCPGVVRQLVSAMAESGPAPRHLLCLSRPAGRTALLEALASPLRIVRINALTSTPADSSHKRTDVNAAEPTGGC
jgi:DNA polymerase III delta prime subunit